MEDHLPKMLQAVYTEQKNNEKHHCEDVRNLANEFQARNFDFRYNRLLEKGR